MALTKIETKLKGLYPSLNDKQLKFIGKKVEIELKSGRKVGKGFFDKLVKGVKKGVSAAKSINADSALNVLSKVTNVACTNKNPKWDYKPKKGEKHQILKNGNCTYRAFFSGPGTQVIPDVKEFLKKFDNNISLALAKENFASDVDREALGHDIRYVLSEGDNKKIREADEKFIKVLSAMKGDKINTLIPLNAMRAKIKAEDAGVIKVYGGDEKANPEDKKLLENVLAHLEQQGFGKSRPKRGSGVKPSKLLPKERTMNQADLSDRQKAINLMDSANFTPAKKKKMIDFLNKRGNKKGFSDESVVEAAIRGNVSKEDELDILFGTDSFMETFKGKGKAKPSKWVNHVKAYAKEHNMKYGDAMKAARASYKK